MLQWCFVRLIAFKPAFPALALSIFRHHAADRLTITSTDADN
jgi:hypothetical protein